MPLRKCPECGSEWYSSDTWTWACSDCGTVLSELDNIDEKESRSEKLREQARGVQR